MGHIKVEISYLSKMLHKSIIRTLVHAQFLLSFWTKVNSNKCRVRLNIVEFFNVTKNV